MTSASLTRIVIGVIISQAKISPSRSIRGGSVGTFLSWVVAEIDRLRRPEYVLKLPEQFAISAIAVLITTFVIATAAIVKVTALGVTVGACVCLVAGGIDKTKRIIKCVGIWVAPLHREISASRIVGNEKTFGPWVVVSRSIIHQPAVILGPLTGKLDGRRIVTRLAMRRVRGPGVSKTLPPGVIGIT
jgi:hypothetical protein